jgi:hypothetical protein
MKIKISILILFLILSINNVYGETEIFSKSVSQEYYANYITGGNIGGISYTNVLMFNDISTTHNINSVTLQIDNYNWYGGPSSEWQDVEYRLNSPTGTLLGTGSYGYNNGSDYVFVIATFDKPNLFSDYTGAQKVFIVGGPNIHFGGSPTSTNLRIYNPANIDTTTKTTVYLGYKSGSNYYASVGGTGHDSNTELSIYLSYDFINEYTYYNDGILNKLEVERTDNESFWTVERGNSIIFEDANYNSTDFSIYDNDLINSTWDIMCNDSYGNTYTDIILFEETDTTPTLTTDKTYYNTSEIIEISFTNIDTIYNECYSSICAKPYDLHILYPVTDAYKDYETKYIYPLTYNLQDESIYLNTSFLSPENNYILGIVGINGDYHKHEDILLFSDSFTVYPDEEYLSVSCDSETSCYTYNNADITIYYQINNNSNIIIKDNNNNIINTYYNIIGSGEKLYHIPDDLYYENTYPNWKIYLNNTEYSTSFNKGVTVYWSQFQTPTPTPTFTPQPTPDINISDEIDNLKDEISPIKDLLFGLSEIVIDNPDYNKDNIVDENEINHWFNSLIPMCIIFLLIILYIGLKKQRE